MTGNVRKLRERQRSIPLRVGDVWVMFGPTSEVTIVALAPRPTSQKPHSQAVTLSDGRTIAEQTFRSNYIRKQEYHSKFLPELRRKLRLARDEWFGVEPQKAKVLPMRGREFPR